MPNAITYEDLPDWSFELDEISAGVYKATGKYISGNEVSCQGTDEKELLAQCKTYAADLELKR